MDDFGGETYRAPYTVRFGDVVYVLHASHKKSRKGKMSRSLSEPNLADVSADAFVSWMRMREDRLRVIIEIRRKWREPGCQ